MATALVGVLAEWVAVTPGQWAYQDLFKDRDYEFINLEAHATVGGNPSANFDEVVDEVEIVYDEETTRKLSPLMLKYMNDRHGPQYGSASPHVRTINFREDFLWNRAESDTMLFFTAYAKKARIRVKLKSGITAPVLTGRYSAKPQRDVAPGHNLVRKTSRDDLDFSGAGTRVIRTILPKGLSKAFLFYHANVTGVKAFVNGSPMKELDSVAAMEEHLKANEMTPQAGVFVLPFDEDQEIEAGLDAHTVQEMILHVTVSGACSVPVVQEFVETLAAA